MPIKSTTITEGGKGGGRKKSRRIYRTSQNIRIINVLRDLSLTRCHRPPHLPRMPSNTMLISGFVVGQLRFQCGPTPVCFCLQGPQLSELVRFLLWELSMTFYIFHRHRVCLVDCVDLICSLYSWWEGFGSSSLATLPLGSNCSFISTSTCGSSTGVSS